jgi:uncharacterized membrane protein
MAGKREHQLAIVAAFCLGSLIALCVYWELFGAPLRPGGSWLVLKVFPLFLPLRGILHQRRYTFQWASLLALAYIAEGLVRATTDPYPSRLFAVGELVLATGFFSACVGVARLSRKKPEPRRAE